MKKDSQSRATVVASAANELDESEFIHYGTGSIVLSAEEMAQVAHDIENPPDGTEGLREILQTIDRGYSP